jgi:4-hydroxyphenylpyruvate dioxygenase
MVALPATGFDGLFSLEIFSDRFRAGSARWAAMDGRAEQRLRRAARLSGSPAHFRLPVKMARTDIA